MLFFVFLKHIVIRVSILDLLKWFICMFAHKTNGNVHDQIVYLAHRGSELIAIVIFRVGVTMDDQFAV